MRLTIHRSAESLSMLSLVASMGDVDALVNATVCLENEEPCVLDELLVARNKEEVVLQHRLALQKFLLRALEVEVHIKHLEELGDRVLVRVRLLLDDLDEILQHVPSPLVGD